MSLDTRIKKLEQRQDLEGGLAVIFMQEGETNEEALNRVYPEGSKKPKAVVYLTPQEALL